MKTLKLIERFAGGVIRIYPNCRDSMLFQKLLGLNSHGAKKTFSQEDMKTINELGYEIDVEPVIQKTSRYK